MTLKLYLFWFLGATMVAAGSAVAWRFAFYVVPVSWTGEPARLAEVLAIRPGMHIADIGAGSGAHALAMAGLVGDAGRVYATELSAHRRTEIERRVKRTGVRNVQLVAAREAETGLSDQCCDAVYIRAVFHHVANRPALASSITRSLRPGGRVAVIDFAPGTLWFHGADHGVRPEVVLRAFQEAGLKVVQRVDDWGGGMFAVVFEGSSTTAGSETATDAR